MQDLVRSYGKRSENVATPALARFHSHAVDVPRDALARRGDTSADTCAFGQRWGA